MKLAIASDHGGVELKSALVNALANIAEVEDLGPSDKTSCDYSDYAVKVAMKVSSGSAEFGILICRKQLDQVAPRHEYHPDFRTGHRLLYFGRRNHDVPIRRYSDEHRIQIHFPHRHPQ